MSGLVKNRRTRHRRSDAWHFVKARCRPVAYGLAVFPFVIALVSARDRSSLDSGWAMDRLFPELDSPINLAANT